MIITGTASTTKPGSDSGINHAFDGVHAIPCEMIGIANFRMSVG